VIHVSIEIVQKASGRFTWILTATDAYGNRRVIARANRKWQTPDDARAVAERLQELIADAEIVDYFDDGYDYSFEIVCDVYALEVGRRGDRQDVGQVVRGSARGPRAWAAARDTDLGFSHHDRHSLSRRIDQLERRLDAVLDAPTTQESQVGQPSSAEEPASSAEEPAATAVGVEYAARESGARRTKGRRAGADKQGTETTEPAQEATPEPAAQ
jgi:hypothetical protein